MRQKLATTNTWQKPTYDSMSAPNQRLPLKRAYHDDGVRQSVATVNCFPIRLRILRFGDGGHHRYSTSFSACRGFIITARSSVHGHKRMMMQCLAVYCECQNVSTRTGTSFLMGIARSEGGVILKSDNFSGMVPVTSISLPLAARWNGTRRYSARWPANWISRSVCNAADVRADSGRLKRTMIIGNSAPRTTSSM